MVGRVGGEAGDLKDQVEERKMMLAPKGKQEQRVSLAILDTMIYKFYMHGQYS